MAAEQLDEIPREELVFPWRGGHPALDFTATLGERWRRKIERLRTPADLSRWLCEAGATTERLPATPATLAGARELREASESATWS